MSTATLDPPAGRPATGRTLKVTFPRVLNSEWIKFGTLRSSWYTLAGAVASLILIGMLIAANTGKHGAASSSPESLAASGPLRGYFLAQLFIAVLGVLFVSGEYGTGQIRSTFSAVPRRMNILSAKALVFAGVALVAMTAAAFATYFVAQTFLTANHHGTSLSDPGALRAVAGTGLYLALIGVFGGALAWIIRSTAGAIAAVLGILLVVPVLVEAIGGSLSTSIGQYLPAKAGSSFITSIHSANTLSPWAGLGVLALWVAGTLGIAAVLLRRRDA
jgi:ABC-2 type transport system permease protein